MNPETPISTNQNILQRAPRLTSWFYSDALDHKSGRLARDRQLRETFHGKMFIDDVRNSIMPFRHLSRREAEFRAFIPGDADGHFAILVGRAISHNGRRPSAQLAEAVSEFFRETITYVLTFGHADYEMVPLVWSILHPDESPAGFELVTIPAGSLSRRRRGYAQLVPNRSGRSGRPSSTRILIPSGRIFCISLSRRWKQIIARALNAFQSTGVSTGMPDFAMDAMTGGSRVPFAFPAFEKADRLATLQACRETGWDARMNLTNQLTTYYYLYRRIQFERFLIALRQELLSELNVMLRQATAEHMIGLPIEVVLEGLRTNTEVDELQRHLEQGTLTFKEIHTKLFD